MSLEAESLAVAVGCGGLARVWVDQARQRLALEPVPEPEPAWSAWGWGWWRRRRCVAPAPAGVLPPGRG